MSDGFVAKSSLVDSMKKLWNVQPTWHWSLLTMITIKIHESITDIVANLEQNNVNNSYFYQFLFHIFGIFH